MEGAGRFDAQLDADLAAAPDDQARLRLLARHITAVERHLDYARGLRVATALQLRTTGLPMLEIAAVAGVGDSYLSRCAIQAGQPRRTTRPRRTA